MQQSFSQKWASSLIDYRKLDDSLPDELLPLEYTASDWNRFCHPKHRKINSVKRLSFGKMDSKTYVDKNQDKTTSKLMQTNVTDTKKRSDFISLEINRVYKKFGFCENEVW